ncbi:MAG: AAA family ATPase [Dehalococcoidia bacterium]
MNNLSAGQRMMLALVADIAIRAVTQNAYLLSEDGADPADDALPRVLQETPGVVVIDELGVHLHPRWQRHVVTDLRRTFPRIQIVATSHSPAIISEIEADSVLLLKQDDDRVEVITPHQSYGLDVNWILDHIMGERSRSESVTRKIDKIENMLEQGDTHAARAQLDELRAILRGDDPAVVSLEAAINNLEALADEDDLEEG